MAESNLNIKSNNTELQEKALIEFLRLVAGPVVQTSGIAEDYVRYFRYKNLLRLRDKVEELHAHRRLQAKSVPLPPKFAVPIIESASLEEEDSIQDLWARLIANATDPNTKSSLHPAFHEVLRQISSDEALLITYLASRCKFPVIVTISSSRRLNLAYSRRGTTYNRLVNRFVGLCRDAKLQNPEYGGTYLDNLTRLSVFQVTADYGVRPRRAFRGLIFPASRSIDKDPTENLENAETLTLATSDFGQKLIALCTE